MSLLVYIQLIHFLWKPLVHVVGEERQKDILQRRIKNTKRQIELALPPHCNDTEGCSPQLLYLESELRTLYRLLYSTVVKTSASENLIKVALYASSTAASRGPFGVHSKQSHMEQNPLFFFSDRCVAAYQTFGQSFYQYTCLVPSHPAVQAYAISSGCKNSIITTSSFLEFDCSETEIGLHLLFTTCSSLYEPGSRGAPCCSLNYALRHALFILESAAVIPDWFIFSDDDEYFRPSNLYNLLQRFDPLQSIALSAKGLTSGIFDNSVFGCEGIVRHVWIQPLILTKTAIISLRTAIQESALNNLCDDFDLFQDVAGGILLWQTNVSIFAIDCCFTDVLSKLARDDVAVHGARTAYSMNNNNGLLQKFHKSHYDIHQEFNDLEKATNNIPPIRYLTKSYHAYSNQSAYSRTPHAQNQTRSPQDSNSTFNSFKPIDCIVACDQLIKHRAHAELPICDVNRHENIDRVQGASLLRVLQIYTQAIREYALSDITVHAALALLRKAHQEFSPGKLIGDKGRKLKIEHILKEAKLALDSRDELS